MEEISGSNHFLKALHLAFEDYVENNADYPGGI
jgi:hypothetical protein